MSHIRKSAPSDNEFFEGHHRFEHWYVDNQVYFLTARVRDKKLAFESNEAKAIFWDRFDHYTAMFDFIPWVTSLIANHYHSLGYLKFGNDLGPMMQKLHGSVAKLVNDLLPQRITPFWGDVKHNDYMDGCIRDEKQASCLPIHAHAVDATRARVRFPPVSAYACERGARMRDQTRPRTRRVS